MSVWLVKWNATVPNASGTIIGRLVAKTGTLPIVAKATSVEAYDVYVEAKDANEATGKAQAVMMAAGFSKLENAPISAADTGIIPAQLVFPEPSPPIEVKPEASAEAAVPGVVGE